MIERISPPGVAAPRGPYSPAVRAGDFIFVSGQVAVDPATQQLITGDIAAETRQVLNNIKALLEGCGATMADVVKCGVFLADANDFAAMNAVYAEFFGDSQAGPHHRSHRLRRPRHPRRNRSHRLQARVGQASRPVPRLCTFSRQIPSNNHRGARTPACHVESTQVTRRVKPYLPRATTPISAAPGTDQTDMDFRRRLPEIRCQSGLSPVP